MSPGRTRIIAHGALAAALLALGCSREDSTVGVTEAVISAVENTAEAQRLAEAFSADDEPARGGGPRAETARDRVAEARCDRMAECGTASDRETCVDNERARVDSWWGDQCDATANAVEVCLADVASDHCPASLDRPFVGNAGDCSRGAVCSKEGAAP